MDMPSKELGQGLAEYAFLFVLVIIVVFVTLQMFGISVVDLYKAFIPLLEEAFT